MLRFLMAGLMLVALSTATLADVIFIPRERLIDEAAVIVVGKIKSIDGATGKGQFDLAHIQVAKVLKGSNELKEVQLQQRPAAAPRLSHGNPQPVGTTGVWLLNAPQHQAGEPGHYQLLHPAQFVPDAGVADIEKLVALRNQLPGGKSVLGLQARAEVEMHGTVAAVRFSLKNVSDKSIAVCTWIGQRALAVDWTGPDGRKIASVHYEWMKSARIRSVTADDFVQLAPGAALFFGPRGIGSLLDLPSQIPGKHKVVVSYQSTADAKLFALENGWNGIAVANEIVLEIK